MSTIWKVIKYSIILACGLITVSCVAIFIIIGKSATSCYEDSEAVAYARSLSEERLAKLYSDMELYSKKDSYEFYELKKDKEGAFPPPFDDIQAVRVRPGEENIMLNGCFDHYVYLHFHGFESNKEYRPNKQIVLSWGEHASAGEEIIWSAR